MTVKIKESDYELKFTFNSFKYIEDFDLSEVENVSKKPFKILGITEYLFYGALNHNKKVVVQKETAETLFETYLEEGNSPMELFELLMVELEESDFFKSLQK